MEAGNHFKNGAISKSQMSRRNFNVFRKVLKNKALVVLAIASIMAVMTAPVIFGQDAPQMIGGELTPDIAWRIENGTLYISGKGVVPTTMFGRTSAWIKHLSQFHSVVIEDGITDVGQNVFAGHTNITSLTIAESVKDFAPRAFSSCGNLAVVEVKGATPPDISLGVFYMVKLANVKLIVPAGTKPAYEADPIWRQFGTIEESAQPAKVPPATVETLAAPYTIHLHRTTNFVGSALKQNVFLNGVEQPKKLRNGQTITLQTDRVKNVLYLQSNKKKKLILCVRRFDATAGGVIHIDYSHAYAYMKIMDEGNEE